MANKESLAKIYQQAFWIKTEKNRKWEKELTGDFGTGEIAKRHKKYRYSGFLRDCFKFCVSAKLKP
ncbi:MAG: hypothetical protein ACRC24_03880 [Vibrionaceae bacterium]